MTRLGLETRTRLWIPRSDKFYHQIPYGFVFMCACVCVHAGERQVGYILASDLKYADTCGHTGKSDLLKAHTWKSVIQGTFFFISSFFFFYIPQPFYPPTHSLLLSPSVGSLWKKAAAAEVGGVEPCPPDAPHTSSYGFSPSAALTSVAAVVGGWVQAQIQLTLVESMRVNFMCRPARLWYSIVWANTSPDVAMKIFFRSEYHLNQ